MKAKGDVHAKPADAPELELDEAFLGARQDRLLPNAPQGLGAFAARSR